MFDYCLKVLIVCVTPTLLRLIRVWINAPKKGKYKHEQNINYFFSNNPLGILTVLKSTAGHVPNNNAVSLVIIICSATCGTDNITGHDTRLFRCILQPQFFFKYLFYRKIGLYLMQIVLLKIHALQYKKYTQIYAETLIIEKSINQKHNFRLRRSVNEW